MDTDLTKQFIDSFHIAKHLTDMLPELPDVLTPRHIRILDTIYTLSQHGSAVRISDISDAMRSTRPSITKLVNELNNKNSSDGNHVGVANVRKRLELYYGEEHEMYFESREGEGTSVHLFICAEGGRREE